MSHKKDSNTFKGISWPALVPGILVKRYKRFLADVKLNDGKIVTAHCPNTGSMTGCCESGRPVYLSLHDNPKRKFKFTWELIEMPTSLVGVNTRIPNRLVALGIARNRINGLAGYREVKPEITVGAKTPVSYTHLTLPTSCVQCRSRWSPYH